MIGNGRKNTISTDKQATVVNMQETEFVKLGRLYTLQTTFTIAIGGAPLILLDPTLVVPNLPSGFIGNIIAYPFGFRTSTGPVIVRIYAGSDYTVGTPLIAINRNDLSSNTPLSVLSLNPSVVSVKGTEFFSYLVGSDSSNQFSGGGGSGSELPFVADPAVKQILEFNNNSGVEITFDLRFTFAEF